MGARRAMRANILAICVGCVEKDVQVDLKGEVASVWCDVCR
jgi:molybdopterin-binding protein